MTVTADTLRTRAWLAVNYAITAPEVISDQGTIRLLVAIFAGVPVTEVDAAFTATLDGRDLPIDRGEADDEYRWAAIDRIVDWLFPADTPALVAGGAAA